VKRPLAVFFATLSLAGVPARAPAATFADVLALPGVAWISDTVPALPSERPTMRQTQRAFVPELLVVPVGASVVFPNDDAFYHSVYSTSPGNAFDLGLYDTGPGKAVTFASAGIVDIRCHVHGSMHATIVVVDGPFARTVTPNERYAIDGVRPGRHTLHVWSSERGESVRTIVVR
jgi:plastocyanin